MNWINQFFESLSAINNPFAAICVIVVATGAFLFSIIKKWEKGKNILLIFSLCFLSIPIIALFVIKYSFHQTSSNSIDDNNIFQSNTYLDPTDELLPLDSLKKYFKNNRAEQPYRNNILPAHQFETNFEPSQTLKPIGNTRTSVSQYTTDPPLVPLSQLLSSDSAYNLIKNQPVTNLYKQSQGISIR